MHSLGVLADPTFDVAVCHSVLHHVPDDLALVGEMARVVRPGGLVFLDREGHDASWNDPAHGQFLCEAWAFPPTRWTRVLSSRNYWKRIRSLFRWQRWRDPRWMPEGDPHIRPDDQSESDCVKAHAHEAGVVPA